LRAWTIASFQGVGNFRHDLIFFQPNERFDKCFIIFCVAAPSNSFDSGLYTPHSAIMLALRNWSTRKRWHAATQFAPRAAQSRNVNWQRWFKLFSTIANCMQFHNTVRNFNRSADCAAVGANM